MWYKLYPKYIRKVLSNTKPPPKQKPKNLTIDGRLYFNVINSLIYVYNHNIKHLQ